jgi:hypothetical protein
MKLARMLKPFGVRPQPTGESRHKGYRLQAFEDAFARYLPSEVVQVVQTANTSHEPPTSSRSSEGSPNDHATGANPHGSVDRTTRTTWGGGNGPGGANGHGSPGGEHRALPILGERGYLDLLDAAAERGHVTPDEVRAGRDVHLAVALAREA